MTIHQMLILSIFIYILEIPDFLSPEEADHIVDVAYGVGFSKSDIHLDPVAKDHAKTLRSTEGNKRFIFQSKETVKIKITLFREEATSD